MDDLAALRAEYAAGGLAEADLAADPLTMFRRWFDEARAAGVHEPNAMVVSTASADGVPSSRFVLLKVLDERGFGFYTNLGSRKGADLAANPRCAVLFPWHPLERQVRIEGRVVELPRAEAAAYFASRPRGAQLGAWASHQSSVVTSRAELDAAYDEIAARFGGLDGDRTVPLPDFWGGYVVVPTVVEFWQGRPGRMHDRLRYRRPETSTSAHRTSTDAAITDRTITGAEWRIERLAP